MAGSFKDLLTQAGFKASEQAEAPPVEQPPAPTEITWAQKVVVRASRKGAGGHTVTVLSGLASGHEDLCKRMRKELGVGARVDGDDLRFQGDVAERVARWLESQGVKRVIRG